MIWCAKLNKFFLFTWGNPSLFRDQPLDNQRWFLQQIAGIFAVQSNDPLCTTPLCNISSWCSAMISPSQLGIFVGVVTTNYIMFKEIFWAFTDLIISIIIFMFLSRRKNIPWVNENSGYVEDEWGFVFGYYLFLFFVYLLLC